MATSSRSRMGAEWEVGSLPISMLYAEILLRNRGYDGYRVVRVEHLKEKTQVGHEFCALYIRDDDDSSKEFVVRIERRPGAPKAAYKAVLTYDSISRLAGDFNVNHTYYHISTTFCKQSPALTFAALCEICAYIQDAAPHYDLKDSKHCYWFCTAFLIRLRVLGHVYPEIEEHEDYKKRGCFGGIRIISEGAVEKDLNSHSSRQLPRKLLPALRFNNPFRSAPAHNGDEWTRTSDLAELDNKGVYSVCFTRDGHHVISGCVDSTIRVWDAATGRKVQPPLRGHTNIVASVAVSPDGRRVASASYDMTVRIWDLEAGMPLSESLSVHTDFVRSVAFSPDGRKVVSGSENGSVYIWDVETCAAVGEPLRGHSQRVTSVAWSPDESRVVSGSDDYTIRLWDTQAGTPVGEPLRDPRAVNSVAFSPDGNWVASGSNDCTVRLWDVTSQRVLGEPLHGHTSSVTSVAFSLDGHCVASGSRDKTVRIWDSTSGGAAGEVARLDAGENPRSVAWSPVGDRVAAGCWDGKIRMWRKVAG